MEKYILIKSSQVFYDGHGSPDDGETSVSVEHTDEYNDLDLTGNTSYTEGDVFDKNADSDYWAEDGYNCEKITYQYLEITKEECKEYSKIILDYNQLVNKIKKL